MGRNLASPILCDTAADLAALFDGAEMFNKTLAYVGQIGTTISSAVLAVPAMYRFVAGSTTPDNNQSQLCVVPGANPAAGKWLRADPCLDLILPITQATANAAALVTIPAELWLLPSYLDPFWEMITAWTGGVAAAIGLSFTNQATVSPVQGSLLGGPDGDTTFPVRSYYNGTPGSMFTSNLKRIVLNPGATINFDRINDQFAAGTGNAHVPCFNTFAPIIPINPS